MLLNDYAARRTFAVDESDSKLVVCVVGEKLPVTTYAKDPSVVIGHACGGRSLAGTKKCHWMSTDEIRASRDITPTLGGKCGH